MAEQLIGKITHYFSRIGVAEIELAAPLSTGDRVHILGHTTDLDQTVDSMQSNEQKIDSAGAGDDVAIKVVDRVRDGDKVYRVQAETGA